MTDSNILAFFAHPDDETMLCGGLLALLAREGMRVHYLCATRGEGGELGEPPVTSREGIGAVRSQELACAVTALGGTSLSFMDYIDPLVGPGEALFAFEANFELLVQQIRQKIQEVSADTLITHGSNGEYGHPAHVLIHQASLQAANTHPNKIALYTVQACFDNHPKPRIANKDDPADLVIDITPLLDQKIHAATCHRSQQALFIRRTAEDLGRRVDVSEVVMPVESLHRVRLNGNQANDVLESLLQRTGLVIS